MEIKNRILVDTGSAFIKAKVLDSQDSLSIIKPNIYADNPLYPEAMLGCMYFDFIHGKEVLDLLGLYKLHYPMEKGEVKNWDQMKVLWENTFKDLKVDPSQCMNVLSMNNIQLQNKEKILQILFEALNVSELNLIENSLLSLYGSGKTTGTVVSSGDGHTQVTCFNDGYSLSETKKNMDVSGLDLTKYIQQSLLIRGVTDLEGLIGREIVRVLKEKMAYTALDYYEELRKLTQNNESLSYDLPDGSEIKLGHEIFASCEAMFNPNLLGKECDGIHKTIYYSIQSSNLNIRPQLYQNIIMTGGNFLHQGFKKRLNKELKYLVEEQMAKTIEISQIMDLNTLSIKGAEVLVSNSSFSNQFIKRKEYQEQGSSIADFKLNSLKI